MPNIEIWWSDGAAKWVAVDMDSIDYENGETYGQYAYGYTKQDALLNLIDCLWDRQRYTEEELDAAQELALSDLAREAAFFKVAQAQA